MLCVILESYSYGCCCCCCCWCVVRVLFWKMCSVTYNTQQNRLIDMKTQTNNQQVMNVSNLFLLCSLIARQTVDSPFPNEILDCCSFGELLFELLKDIRNNFYKNLFYKVFVRLFNYSLSNSPSFYQNIKCKIDADGLNFFMKQAFNMSFCLIWHGFCVFFLNSCYKSVIIFTNLTFEANM
jgi:hypothetical protein